MADQHLAAEGTTGPVELSTVPTADEGLEKGRFLLRRKPSFSSKERRIPPSKEKRVSPQEKAEFLLKRNANYPLKRKASFSSGDR